MVKKPEPVAKTSRTSIFRYGAQRAGALQSSSTVPGVGRFLHWPVAGGGNGFAMLFWLAQWYRYFFRSIGTNLVAAAPGVVTFAGCQSGGCPSLGSLYGGWGLLGRLLLTMEMVCLRVYGHMRNIYVSSGQSVSRGSSFRRNGLNRYSIWGAHSLHGFARR
jgi:murein DD-endopeptidase MepM/ murein hydrolase activator NlpD